MQKQWSATIESDKGFYVGDICYVLGDTVYDKIWGGMYGYQDGAFEVPGTGHSFAVTGTGFGDGVFVDSTGSRYPIDSGTIGIVPLELVEKSAGLNNGEVYGGKGHADFDAFDKGWMCKIELDNGETFEFGAPDVVEEELDEEPDEEPWDIETGFDPYLGCYTDDV